MTDASLGTPEQLRDPNYTPALAKAVPLGIQHVLAMFVSNVTPAIIVAGAAGFGFGSDAGAQGFPDMTYLIPAKVSKRCLRCLAVCWSVGCFIRCWVPSLAGYALPSRRL